MNIKPIRSDADYREALKEIEGLMDAQRGTARGDRLDVLVTLVESWERAHYPMDLPDPIEALRFEMERSGLEPKDLVPMIGKLNRVYEVLNRKRPLTLRMIWNLNQQLGIPLECLVKAPKDSKAA
jgi:HTH-type transcriptional regulator / antitoxin HigA